MSFRGFRGGRSGDVETEIQGLETITLVRWFIQLGWSFWKVIYHGLFLPPSAGGIHRT